MNRKLFIAGNALLVFTSILLLSAKKDNAKKAFNCKAFEKSLCSIPMGGYMFEDSAYLPNCPTKMKMVSVKPFYMCNHLVTNEEYGMFLDDIKTTNSQLYNQMLPDTMVWRNKQAYMEDMVKYYFRHPAYHDYPVVGISYTQAKEYCKWLTEKYEKEPKRKYKNAVYKLPNLYQWDWAAHGGLANSPFPWGSSYLTNSNPKYKGQRMANYRFVSEQSVKRAGDTGKLELTNYDPFYSSGSASDLNDAADITSPVLSYWPNGYGLYDMAGNVQEYIAEPGITKGGSWYDPAYYLQIWAEQHYKNAQSASDRVGFRVAMELEQ